MHGTSFPNWKLLGYFLDQFDRNPHDCLCVLAFGIQKFKEGSNQSFAPVSILSCLFRSDCIMYCWNFDHRSFIGPCEIRRFYFLGLELLDFWKRITHYRPCDYCIFPCNFFISSLSSSKADSKRTIRIVTIMILLLLIIMIIINTNLNNNK